MQPENILHELMYSEVFADLLPFALGGAWFFISWIYYRILLFWLAKRSSQQNYSTPVLCKAIDEVMFFTSVDACCKLGFFHRIDLAECPHESEYSDD